MLAARASIAPTTRPARRQVAAVAPPVVARPTRFTRNELVDLLRDYRSAPGLTPEQRREAVAWIVGHQAEGA